MTFPQYLKRMEDVVQQEVRPAPYDQADYHQYAKLNLSRTKRWLQKGQLLPELIDAVKALQTPQKWLVITEPWCGDAAHSVPFIALLAELNPLITLSMEHRDAEPFRIEQYLTQGSKSIPKWIIQNAEGEDLWVWGPRPRPIQAQFEAWKAAELSFDAIKEEIQKVYNEDAGQSLQKEFLSFLLK